MNTLKFTRAIVLTSKGTDVLSDGKIDYTPVYSDNVGFTYGRLSITPEMPSRDDCQIIMLSSTPGGMVVLWATWDVVDQEWRTAPGGANGDHLILVST